MSGFSATVELGASRPPWGLAAIASALLLAALAVLVSDLPLWLRLAILAALALACAHRWQALRAGGIAPGIAAVWLVPSDGWRLVLDTGEMQKAELLHRQGFVTRGLVGLTLRRDCPGKRRGEKLTLWITPAMLSAPDWRRLQVRLRHP